MRNSVFVALMALAGAPALAGEVAGGLESLNRLCRTTIEKRDYDEAQRICKRINFDAEKMAPGSTAHLTSILNMGDIKARVENYVEADAYYSAALRLVDRNIGPDSETAFSVITQLTEFKLRRGKYLDAAELAKRALAIREKLGGANAMRTAIARARYADLLSQSHQFLDAEVVYAQALAALEHGGRPTADAYALTSQHLGEMYERRSQYKQAEQQYRRVVEIIQRHGLSYRLLAGAYDRLAFVCQQQDRPADAAALYRRAIATLRGTPASREVIARLQAQLTALESPATPSPLAVQGTR